MPSEIIYLLSLLYTSVCLQQPPQPRWVCFCFVGWGAGMGGGRRAGFRSLFAEPSRAICLGREDKSKECVGFPVSKLSLLSNQKKKKKKSRFNQPQCPGAGREREHGWESLHSSIRVVARGTGRPTASPQLCSCRVPAASHASASPYPLRGVSHPQTARPSVPGDRGRGPAGLARLRQGREVCTVQEGNRVNW